MFSLFIDCIWYDTTEPLCFFKQIIVFIIPVRYYFPFIVFDLLHILLNLLKSHCPLAEKKEWFLYTHTIIRTHTHTLKCMHTMEYYSTMRKKGNHTISNTDGPWCYNAKWYKWDRETQTLYYLTYMWNLQRQSDRNKK